MLQFEEDYPGDIPQTCVLVKGHGINKLCLLLSYKMSLSSSPYAVKPNRNTRRLNSVPDQFTPDPNEINGDISRKVPLHPPSAVTNQTHTGDVESPPPPPKPPRQRRSASRSEFASVGEEEEEEEDEEFAAGIMGCEGNGVDDREEMEGSSEYVEQAMSSQSSNGEEGVRNEGRERGGRGSEGGREGGSEGGEGGRGKGR